MGVASLYPLPSLVDIFFKSRFSILRSSTPLHCFLGGIFSPSANDRYIYMYIYQKYIYIYIHVCNIDTDTSKAGRLSFQGLNTTSQIKWRLFFKRYDQQYKLSLLLLDVAEVNMLPCFNNFYVQMNIYKEH